MRILCFRLFVLGGIYAWDGKTTLDGKISFISNFAEDDGGKPIELSSLDN